MWQKISPLHLPHLYQLTTTYPHKHLFSSTISIPETQCRAIRPSFRFFISPHLLNLSQRTSDQRYIDRIENEAHPEQPVERQQIKTAL